MTINLIVDGGHLGFMKIVGLAETCLPGNKARFILEHISIPVKNLHCTQPF